MSTVAKVNGVAGRTALVTGATRNLGLTIAGAFAEQGARVIVHGPTREEAEAACDGLARDYPRERLRAVGFDLTRGAEIDAAFAALREAGWSPDVLVSNAAHLGLGRSGLLEQSDDFFREVIETNLMGCLRCSQRAAEGMKAAGGGSIVVITSLAGERALHGRSAYSVSKAALDALVRSMALELAEFGITVNSVAPGYVWTPRWNDLPADHVERRRLNAPVGGPVEQREIAETVLFLAAGRTPSLTGTRIVIDGGLGAQFVPRDVNV